MQSQHRRCLFRAEEVEQGSSDQAARLSLLEETQIQEHPRRTKQNQHISEPSHFLALLS